MCKHAHASVNSPIYIINAGSNLLNTYYMPDNMLNTFINTNSNPYKNPMIRSLTYFPKMASTSFITHAVLEPSCSPLSPWNLIPLPLNLVASWESIDDGKSNPVWLLRLGWKRCCSFCFACWSTHSCMLQPPCSSPAVLRPPCWEEAQA